MFKKILIANRGEIALRIIRSAQRLNIQCVAVYSDADRNAEHVRLADEACYIGPSAASESYLNIDAIIDAAKKCRAEAIHPGYGFLSENADFATRCKKENIIFIGPPASAISAMGLKHNARDIMLKKGVPVTPGFHDKHGDPKKLLKEIESIGYPVLLKAVAGGGGKGMRVVHKESELTDSYHAARREAKSAFGDDQLLVEKYFSQTRHIEIQIFTDQHQNGVYLHERDCSAQRRNQKVIEEAPAQHFSPELRKKMGTAALEAANAIGYVGAGTIEFLLNADHSFYFMEMNTRLQVEHPVTEMITGLDLVEWQLIVANGGKLPLTQEQIPLNGHAIEARIYAEDPDNNFMPTTGTIHFLKTPVTDKHIRIDSGIHQGDTISPYYDPMIAKLIVWEKDRVSASKALQKSLSQMLIAGVKTNIPFLYQLSQSNAFQTGTVHTRYIESNLAELLTQHEPDNHFYESMAALAFVLKERCQYSTDSLYSPWDQLSGWQLNSGATHEVRLKTEDGYRIFQIKQSDNQEKNKYTIESGSHSIKVLATRDKADADQICVEHNSLLLRITAIAHQNSITLFHNGMVIKFDRYLAESINYDHEKSAGSLTAPMNGLITDVLVSDGDTVEENTALMIMEAMKMEVTIRSPRAGIIKNIHYKKGDLVEQSVELLSLEAVPPKA